MRAHEGELSGLSKREALKNVNDHVAEGGGGFTAQASCKLVGVPAFLLHPAQPIYFIQTVNEVVMIWPPNCLTFRSKSWRLLLTFSGKPPD